MVGVKRVLLILLGIAVVTVAYRSWTFHRDERRGRVGELFPHARAVWREVKFEGTPLGEVLADFSRRAGCRIEGDWAALAAAGITRETPVRLRLYDVRAVVALQALRLTLDEVTAEEGDRAAWAFDADGVRLTNAVGMRRERVLVGVYWPLSLPPPEALPPTYQSNGIEEDATIRWGMEDVDPDSWRDNGGTLGACAKFGGRIFVVQTRHNHLRIQARVEALRRQITSPGVQPALRLEDGVTEMP